MFSKELVAELATFVYLIEEKGYPIITFHLINLLNFTEVDLGRLR